jgi:Putative MetA-pathway of phenol degradation
MVRPRDSRARHRLGGNPLAGLLLALLGAVSCWGADRTRVPSLFASRRPEYLAHEVSDELAFAITAGALPSNTGFLAYVGNSILSSDFVDRVATDDNSSSEVPFEQQASTDPSYPDITEPGPDTSNFPNGPYTLPKGRSYVENSPVGFYGPAGDMPKSYLWEFLLRYGVTDYLEFRIFSNGLSVQGEPDPVTGFSPLAFDLKLHCWEENCDFLLPAVGLEVYLQTEFGSPAFNMGTQPSLWLLLDQSLLWGIDFNYNFGLSGVENGLGQVAYQFSFDWAFQRDVTECLSVFVQGYYNESALPRPAPAQMLPADAAIPGSNVVGAGGMWNVSPRVALWGSYNFGTTSNSPQTIAIAGFGVAF